MAIGKGTGGARLIGICAALYRIWARVRYAHCRVLLEARLIRPFFAAAPHRGAEKSAFEASLDAEAAAARGFTSAASTVDMHKFYEHITVLDFAKGAAEIGIPPHRHPSHRPRVHWPEDAPGESCCCSAHLSPTKHHCGMHVGHGSRACHDDRPS